MNTSPNGTSRIHPLIAGAAVSVALVSLVGIAAMAGWLPSSHSSTTAQVATAPAMPIEQQTTATPGPSLQQAMQTGSNAPQSAQNMQNAQTSPSRQYNSQRAGGEPAPLVAAVCHSCGTVESVREIVQPAERGSGVGVVAGAVLGGVLGNQIGGGNGRKLATVAGAVGGGVAGNQIERNANSTTSYRIGVRMEDGSHRVFTRSHASWSVGDRVRVSHGDLTARG